MFRSCRPFRNPLAAGAFVLALIGPAPLSAGTQPDVPLPARPGSAADTKPDARSSPDTQSSFIYKLTNADRLRVVVFGEPDLATVTRIDARGNINLYLVGDVHVAGCTVNEAQKIIEAAYRDGRFLRGPQVTDFGGGLRSAHGHGGRSGEVAGPDSAADGIDVDRLPGHHPRRRIHRRGQGVGGDGDAASCRTAPRRSSPSTWTA